MGLECGSTITSGGQPDGRLRGGLCDQLRLLLLRDLPGGIQGVPLGQREAAQVLGFTRRQIFFKVTLLQMIKRIIAPMSNEIITLVKDTSLARIIAITELIKAGEAYIKAEGYHLAPCSTPACSIWCLWASSPFSSTSSSASSATSGKEVPPWPS